MAFLQQSWIKLVHCKGRFYFILSFLNNGNNPGKKSGNLEYYDNIFC